MCSWQCTIVLFLMSQFVSSTASLAKPTVSHNNSYSALSDLDDNLSTPALPLRYVFEFCCINVISGGLHANIPNNVGHNRQTLLIQTGMQHVCSQILNSPLSGTVLVLDCPLPNVIAKILLCLPRPLLHKITVPIMHPRLTPV